MLRGVECARRRFETSRGARSTVEYTGTAVGFALGWAVAITAFLIASQVIARIDPESWSLKTVLAARRNGFGRASRAGA